MTLNKKQREFIKNAPKFEEHILEQLQDPEYQKYWLELTLQEFIEDGNADRFIMALTRVVKARGRGEITRLAKELDIDRSNLSEIVNGNKKPRLSTALKLIGGLGYKCDITLKIAKSLS